MNNIGVHQTHCCILHGCKYGSPECPVVNGDVEQKYICEECYHFGIKTIKDLKSYMNNEVKKCPYCGHIL